MKTASPLMSRALAAAIVAVAGTAAAAPISRQYQQNAASHCQGALPAFVASLRARPLGIENEGTSTAFLTCSFPRPGVFVDPVERISVYFVNSNAGHAITINCTGVFGSQRGVPVYIPKSVVANAFVVQNIVWDDVDNGGDPLPGPGNVSCALPPGGAMLDTFNYFDVEIGT